MAPHDLARERTPLPVPRVRPRVVTTRTKQPSCGTKLSRAVVRWALTDVVIHHLTMECVAQALDVSWNTANTAVLAEGARPLINDPVSV